MTDRTTDGRVGGFRRAWRRSGLNATKVVATGLAAITMALIAPRIAGLTSSLIAVGLISVATAVVNAFISSATEATADSAKRLARAGVAAGVIRVPASAVRATGVGEVAVDVAQAGVDDADAAVDGPVADDAATVDPGAAGEAEDADAEAGPSPRMQRLQRVFRSNSVYLALFALIAIVTITASWIVAQATGDTTYVQPTVVYELSDEQKQEIIDEAVASARSAVESGDVPVGETDDGTAITLDDLLTEYTDLRTRVDALDGTPSPEQSDLAAQLADLSDRIAELEAQLAATGTPSPTPTPTETPSPSPEVTAPPAG
ncbi:hypothetical protein EDD28_1289 [Salana multivorans]|uniref:Uncharacterized protein n=1 Tax=Salana multivorans TaxID=120377 RepID=A0A3N2DA72_9MICO|nr:HalX domain-containing protein [Salana multivorans]ROR96699.1 hypothetical protein EDD28_1289 [Salana multivorans]